MSTLINGDLYPSTSVYSGGQPIPVADACTGVFVFMRHLQSPPGVYITAMLIGPYGESVLSSMFNSLNVKTIGHDDW